MQHIHKCDLYLITDLNLNKKIIWFYQILVLSISELIKPNFCFDLSHWRSITVSLETRNPDWSLPNMLYIVLFSLCRSLIQNEGKKKVLHSMRIVETVRAVFCIMIVIILVGNSRPRSSSQGCQNAVSWLNISLACFLYEVWTFWCCLSNSEGCRAPKSSDVENWLGIRW